MTTRVLFPESKDELKEMMKAEIDKNGKECSLNHIDVSAITDMSGLLRADIDSIFKYKLHGFNGDISEWDVSNVENMERMFTDSEFSKNISKWKVNKNCGTSLMFDMCPIKKVNMPKDLQDNPDVKKNKKPRKIDWSKRP